MPASIRITLHQSPGGPVVGPILVDQSRDDLRKGYQVVLESVNVHTTYSWAISFKPESPDRTDSSAALLPPEGATSSVAKFNVDYEGAYLIRLVADAGLPTEDTKYLRLRFVTRFGNIKLVAAGERRDENGVIPMDATPEGWTNDQNQNLQLLLAQVRRQATQGGCCGLMLTVVETRQITSTTLRTHIRFLVRTLLILRTKQLSRQRLTVTLLR